MLQHLVWDVFDSAVGNEGLEGFVEDLFWDVLLHHGLGVLEEEGVLSGGGEEFDWGQDLIDGGSVG